MSARHHTIAIGLLAALATHSGFAAEPDSSKALLEQGRYWQARGNNARAAEAWGRLLQLDPKQADALYNLGLLELDAKRPANAQGYLKQIQDSGASPVYAAQLEQEIALRSGTKPKELEQARVLAESGDLDKAIPAYRTVFGGKTPQGKVALEYYGYLGYTNDGWEESRQGLERLLRESPDDAQIALVLAKHLARNESTRPEGIRRLAKLSTRADIGGGALESWRMALTWYTNPTAAEAPLFDAYLKVHPEDTEIRELSKKRSVQKRTQTAQQAQQAPQDPSLAIGFKQLDGGDLVAAEAAFQQRLANKPGDSDALGGLGLVRLQQERPDDAVELLTRAVRQSGARTNWKAALTTAQYWSFNSNAEKLRASGDLPSAQQALEQAIKLNTGDSNAEIALGRVQAESGQLDAAEKTYRRLLARDKDSFPALQGLINVLAQTDRVDEAIRLIDPLTPSQQEKIGSIGALRATQARSAAKAASARGDDATAQQLLESGLRYEPNDPWLRLDLARLYLKSGATTEARGLVDGLLLTNPELPGALVASALVSAEVKDWDASLAALEKIAPQNRTRDIVELQKSAWTHQQAARASQLAAAGQKAQALDILHRLEPELGQAPDLLGTVATAYVDAGDPARGLTMLRTAISRNARPDNSLLLQYASVLVKSNQDAEAAGVLRELQGKQLSDSDRQGFEDLRKLYTVRQAELLRERGKLADAYDVLAPMLTQYPTDPLVLGSLARMYASAGDGAKSLAIYKQLLQRTPEDTDLLIAASQAAVLAKDNAYADSALQTAMTLQPNSSKVLSGAARVYRSQGKSGKAAEYLKLAIAAQNQERANASASLLAVAQPAAEPAVEDSNPFSTLPGQTRNRPAVVQAAGSAPAQALPVAPPASQPMAVLAPKGNELYANDATPRGAASSPAAYASAQATAPAAVPATASRPSPAPAPAARTLPAPSSAVAAPRFDAELPAPARSDVAAAKRLVPAYEPAYDIPAPVAESAPLVAEPAPSPFRRAAPPAERGQAAADNVSTRTLEQELDEIQQARSAIITVGTVARQHKGEAGLGRLVDVETPVTVQFPVGESDARAFVQATPVILRSGEPASSFDVSSRFGGGPAAAAAQAAGTAGGPGNQQASGVGVAVGYQNNGIKVDIGSTPFGFRYQNVVGGIRLTDNIQGGADRANISYGIDVSRRAVTDSILSFAGARDSRTGESWGGVTATGAKVSAGADFEDYGIYGNAGWHSINGHNVDSNSRVSGTVGTYVHVIRQANRQLTTGINLTGMFYDKNLGYYTFGQGGYFSPQTFLSASVPVTWAARDGRMSYSVRGSLGVQHIKQDSSPYFSDSARQAQAESTAAANNGTATYAGQSKTGLGYGLAAAAEFQVTPNTFVGGQLGVDNSRDYRQFAGGLYLRYALERQAGPMPFPVAPVASPYAAE